MSQPFLNTQLYGPKTLLQLLGTRAVGVKWGAWLSLYQYDLVSHEFYNVGKYLLIGCYLKDLLIYLTSKQTHFREVPGFLYRVSHPHSSLTFNHILNKTTHSHYLWLFNRWIIYSLLLIKLSFYITKHPGFLLKKVHHLNLLSH